MFNFENNLRYHDKDGDFFRQGNIENNSLKMQCYYKIIKKSAFFNIVSLFTIDVKTIEIFLDIKKFERKKLHKTKLFPVNENPVFEFMYIA